MALTRPRYSQIYDTDYKQSVRLATTADVGNLAVTSSAVDEVDGIPVAVGDRILVKNQDDGTQNGIYEVLVVGTGSNGTWRRALDADANDKVTSGLTTVITAGTVNANKTFRLTTADPITLGVSNLTFVDPFVAGSYAAGSNTAVQFNDAGILAGDDAGFAYFKGNDTIRVGNVRSSSGIYSDSYFYSNGAPFVSSNYSNTDVASYLTIHSGNVNGVFIGNVQTDNIFYANGTPFVGGSTLPSFAGNIGRYLSTDGNVAIWQTLESLPIMDFGLITEAVDTAADFLDFGTI